MLGEKHRVYAIDLTGTGYSSVSPPFDARHLAAQVLAFLRAMHLTGPDAPVLVGHSSGAAVVGMAALADSRAAPASCSWTATRCRCRSRRCSAGF